LSLGGSSPYTSADKAIKNKYKKIQTIQNTVNTSTLITKTPTRYTLRVLKKVGQRPKVTERIGIIFF